MKKPRKKIVRKGWAILWETGAVSFYITRKAAENLMSYYENDKDRLFRCEIREI